MSTAEELTLVVIITTRPGKGQRFLDLSTAAYKAFEKKEPWCLQFQIIRSGEESDDTKEQRWAIIERYASKAHHVQHQSTPQFKQLFKTFMAEELLAGPPVDFEGNAADMGHRDRVFEA